MKSTKLLLLTFALSGALVACKDEGSNDDENNMPPMKTADLYVSSNTTGMLGMYNVADPANVSNTMFSVGGADADGVYYDAANDRLFQYDRTNKMLNAYNGFSGMIGMLTPSYSIAVAIDNGREITMEGNTIVIASNSDMKLAVISTDGSTFNIEKYQTLEFESWGIQLVNNTLYAIVDKTSDLAVFNNYSSIGAGDIKSSKTVTIEGLVRTHGIHYVADMDVMLLTDVGDAADGADGGLHVIKDFSSKWNMVNDGGTLAATDQFRISGSASLLGNPVDVAYDKNNNMIYVAERKNSGGRVLGFTMPSSNLMTTPDYNEMFDGAAAVYMQN